MKPIEPGALCIIVPRKRSIKKQNIISSDGLGKQVTAIRRVEVEADEPVWQTTYPEGVRPSSSRSRFLREESGLLRIDDHDPTADETEREREVEV